MYGRVERVSFWVEVWYRVVDFPLHTNMCNLGFCFSNSMYSGSRSLFLIPECTGVSNLLPLLESLLRSRVVFLQPLRQLVSSDSVRIEDTVE